MDILTLTVKVMGVYLVVSGLFLIVRGKTVPILLKDFFSHPAIVYLTGIILIFLSSMYLIQYNVWDSSWKTVVTVFAWLILIKGLGYVFIPQVLNEVSIRKFRTMFGVYGLVSVVVGVYLFFLN